MKYTLTLDLGKVCPGQSHLDALALLVMRHAATLDGLALAPRGDTIADDTGAEIGAWLISDDTGQGPGLPHPSRADLLDAAGALREVANDRREEAKTLEAYSASDAQGLRDVAPLYEETADRLEAFARALPSHDTPSGADLEA